MLPTAGSDMPYTVQAVDILRKAKVIVAPAKATAAGEGNTLLDCYYKSINALLDCSYILCFEKTDDAFT
jgi:precorrin-2 methylase